MIAYLSGEVFSKEKQSVVLNVNGVGYKVFTTTSTLQELKSGGRAELFCYTYVKEGALDLYGFRRKEGLELFKMLLAVSGIGPKTALEVLSLGPPEKTSEAISRADVDYFNSVPRLSKKNAQKIIIELKSKIGGLAELDLQAEGSEFREVVEALKTLGFSRNEARESYRAVRDKAEDPADILKAAIRYLGRPAAKGKTN